MGVLVAPRPPAAYMVPLVHSSSGVEIFSSFFPHWPVSSLHVKMLRKNLGFCLPIRVSVSQSWNLLKIRTLL